MSTMFSSNSASSSTPFPPAPRPRPPPGELDVVVRLAMTAIVPSLAAWCAPTRHGHGHGGRSGHREAAVDPDDLPGDVVAGPAGQEHRGPGEVTRKPVAAHHRAGRQGPDPGRVGRYAG